MFTLVFVTSAVLIVQVLSTTSDTFLGSFYGSVNQRLNEFSQRNNSKTTLGGRNYDEVLCTVQFLNAMDALNRTDLWALTGELNFNMVYKVRSYCQKKMIEFLFVSFANCL